MHIFKMSFASSKLILLPLVIVLFVLSDISCSSDESPDNNVPQTKPIKTNWKRLSENRPGKVIFARPPLMIILNLTTGQERPVPGIVTEGAPGRRLRGQTPRPFWSPDGTRFVYRYHSRVYVSDEKGHRKVVYNDRMDCTDESRWSWFQQEATAWLVGPSKDKNVLMVLIADPQITRLAYSGGDVVLHCELTGTGRYLVYDDDRDIYVTPFGSSDKGIRISKGQSCRPCAAPDDRVAWLPTPHTRYLIHRASDGLFLAALNAPPGEEIYRLNWSNDPDFAAHMYGSDSNNRMHVRKISTGEALYIGEGWDPDLWVGPKR
jgi:hypothetical protein